MPDVQEEPLAVEAVDGFVLISGPSTALTLTPDAAAISSDRLLEAAATAQGQPIASLKDGG